MGSCCGKPKPEEETNQATDRERLRELQAQAAEKRMRENESRGIKNIESVKRQQAKKEQMEQLQANQGNTTQDGLRWTVG